MAEGCPDVCQTFLYHANVLGTYAARSAGVERRLGGLRVAEARRLRLLAERRAVTRMSRLICVSDAVRQFAIRGLGCDPSTIRVIPNGVDVARFDHAAPVTWERFGWPRDASVSLFVGRLHAQKGIDSLAAEIDRLAPAATNRKLLIVGDGPLRHQVKRLCERIGADRVRWLGWQPEIGPFMRAARVLLLPSHYEGLPNVVLEAMASGLPVVFSRVEGSGELFPNDEGLQTFRPGDHAEMARLATRFLEDGDLAAATGAANREHVRERFSLAAMVDAYRACYQELRGDCEA
jgi:glycosyltransferase involved in cell wall biosynthesis